MKNTSVLVVAALLAGCDEPSRAILRGGDAASADVADVINPADVADVVNPADVADVVNPADVADVVNPADVTDAGSPADVIDVVNPADVIDVVNPADVVDVPPAMDIVDVPSAMDIVDIPPAMDIVDIPPAMDIVDVPPPPRDVLQPPPDVPSERVGAPVAGDCAQFNGGCSTYAACVPAGAGQRRCVCAAGLRIGSDQRSCAGLLLVSIDRDGRAGSTDSGYGSIAARGRYVAFSSASPQLSTQLLPTALDEPSTAQCYVRDVLAGRTILVSATANGENASGGACGIITLTQDGRRAFFNHGATLTPDDRPPHPVINPYTRAIEADFTAGAVQRIRLDSATAGEPRSSIDGIAASRDGRRVVVATRSRLASSDTDGEYDLYAVDYNGTSSSAPLHVSVRTGGVAASFPGCAGGNVSYWAFSGDGNVVAFDTARNIDPADSDNLRDVYLHDIPSRTTVLLSSPRLGPPRSDCEALAQSVTLSGEGRFALFQSNNPAFDGTLQRGQPDYFLRDRSIPSAFDDGALVRLVVNDVAPEPGAISDDGRVIYVTSQRRIDMGGSEGSLDPSGFHLFRIDFTNFRTPLANVAAVDRDADGTLGAGQAGGFGPVSTADGSAVVFMSTQRLVPEDANTRLDVYLRVYR